ncbi:PAS domain-containing hybrid sensor histidine kinase/response regulator [Sulfitobacter sp. S190]|uniref:hybrid sensor histidine kinase/response regulator n=1 Tax=Sulfitobacter sp. S190 TaxID=2867022 RepID=UPI0021A58B4A|nr:PAS domain-containing hybrid sensor histidine kinase/response regulator [Sulfitobacter sp. S190]UWR22003.1 PAS domain S-box protein [Sulfitobacter sp. S190]
MSTDLPKRAIRGRAFALIAGGVAILAIAILTFNVAREIRVLESAQSDNVQWSLVQSQVEFIDFQNEVAADPIDLAKLRQEFDVFFSRVTTLEQATVFEGLRADPTSRQYLDDLLAFLDDAVVIIDGPDDELIARLPDLAALTRATAPVTRALANSGLDTFAQVADEQRQAMARTVTQLAIAIAALIAVLTLTVLFLNRLNARIYRRERENRQTSTRMTTVMSTSLDGVIVCDSNGDILEFSPAAEAIFGYKEADVLGKDIGSVIVPDHLRSAHDAGMERMRDKGEKRVVGKGRVQLEAKRHDGQVFPVELAIQSATTDQGEIFIAFLRDISHRVAAEAELVAARDKALAGEKLKTDFLSTMSHEIRTPLNGLLGNMNLLRDTKLDADQDRYVGHMETSGRLLMSHISDVLDITRYDAGKLSTRSEPVNISELLQDIIDNQSGAAAKNGTSLSWSWHGHPVHWILSDHDRLQHVMMNLIGNAVKFTTGGKVDVSIKNTGTPDATELRVKITDTGPGLSQDLAERVFDDFVTGNTAYDRNVDGTGLGLSIAKRFINALGGEIGVDSTLGKGSTFWVSIPVEATTAPTQHTPEVDDVHATAPLNVLLVEDNEVNRIVAREMLQSDRHIVTEANDGAEGVSAAAKECFDLILMDISMPVMDGRAATRAIRGGSGLAAKTPIVALTANAMIEEQQKFLADGMDEILTKPLSRDALRAMINRVGTMKEHTPVGAMLDAAHMSETRDSLGNETFERLLSRFEQEAEDLIDWLATHDASDLAEIASRTHKVAGSAAVFGAGPFREALRAIETAAKRGDVDFIVAARGDLVDVWKSTARALESD